MTDRETLDEYKIPEFMKWLPRTLCVRYLLTPDIFHAEILSMCDMGYEEHILRLETSFYANSSFAPQEVPAVSYLKGHITHSVYDHALFAQVIRWAGKSTDYAGWKQWLRPIPFVGVHVASNGIARTVEPSNQLWMFYTGLLVARITDHAVRYNEMKAYNPNVARIAEDYNRLAERFWAFAQQNQQAFIKNLTGE